MKRHASHELASATPGGPLAIGPGQEYVDVWWTGSLQQGHLQRYNPKQPNPGTVYVNGKETNETVYEVLNRLGGTIACHSQAAYKDIHTRSWTLLVRKENTE
jgi:hypothetical protein